jgi:hypothetical protein
MTSCQAWWGLAFGEGHRRDARVRQDHAALTALAAGFAADKIKAGMPKADYGLT